MYHGARLHIVRESAGQPSQLAVLKAGRSRRMCSGTSSSRTVYSGCAERTLTSAGRCVV